MLGNSFVAEKLVDSQELNSMELVIFVPASEHGYFVAS
jgi:hypothetical protein